GAFKAQAVAQAGFGVLLGEYRGYGGNSGAPSETGFYEDAHASARFLESRGIARGRWVLYGESVGAGPALELARALSASGHGAVGGVILEAAFTSTAAVAARHYWYLPTRLIVRDRFDNAEGAPRSGPPPPFPPGGRDERVRGVRARRLFEPAGEPKSLTLVPEAGHNNLWGPESAAVVIAFVRGAAR